MYLLLDDSKYKEMKKIFLADAHRYGLKGTSSTPDQVIAEIERTYQGLPWHSEYHMQIAAELFCRVRYPD